MQQSLFTQFNELSELEEGLSDEDVTGYQKLARDAITALGWMSRRAYDAERRLDRLIKEMRPPSESLQMSRQSSNMSLEDAAASLGITIKHLCDLEAGRTDWAEAASYWVKWQRLGIGEHGNAQ